MSKKILILFFVTITMMTGCGCENKKPSNPEENKPQINEEVLKEQQVGVLKIHDVEMDVGKQSTVFTIFMLNTSEEDLEIKNFNINFKDENGNLLLDEPVKTPFYSTIKANEIQSLSVLINKDVSNAKEVIYELVD